nr:MAG TPA: hypothetical protein [Caudoviricetes sp.]DAP13897.1 MAG TPA: hypothetical protein [Bacteriophage sp.]
MCEGIPQIIPTFFKDCYVLARTGTNRNYQ